MNGDEVSDHVKLVFEDGIFCRLKVFPSLIDDANKEKSGKQWIAMKILRNLQAELNRKWFSE